MAETINKDIKDIVDLINRTNESFLYEVWVPSLNKNIMFREINTSQQKRLIKSIVDSPIHNTELIMALKQIINENCADTTINTDELTILDKLFIGMKMRSVSIGDRLEIEIETNKKTGAKSKIVFSVDDIIAKARAAISMDNLKSNSIKDDSGNYELECNIPSIGTEYLLEEQVRKGTSDQEIDTQEKLRVVLGDTFVSEIAKFIRTISIKNGDSITKIDLTSIPFRSRITILEKLPAKLIDKVMNYIRQINDEISKITLLKVNIEIDGVPTLIEDRLVVDGNFFTAS